jgi:hypothetical protein
MHILQNDTRETVLTEGKQAGRSLHTSQPLWETHHQLNAGKQKSSKNQHFYGMLEFTKGFEII